jgi:aconitate hydratase
MCALEFEAMGLEDIKAPLAVANADDLLLEVDNRNVEDHLLLQSPARRFGMRYSGPDNGVSHAVHQQRIEVPGKSLLGADSHTPAVGSLRMLAIGAGGCGTQSQSTQSQRRSGMIGPPSLRQVVGGPR